MLHGASVFSAFYILTSLWLGLLDIFAAHPLIHNLGVANGSTS